ncbi:C40 family peptidase [Actinoallomurus iriomotensis]|uniref:NlpC/P60 domain-containing protein n=1 Tax=Actinoallomurus iriomotensis TaxID=478107 RepID=A0A9W6S6R5_9ACTN|nr:NlpC/P60 family protein [Actinoallomurus iriomotensis]GLY88153.1 hypothetical protein Airi02_060820 [Actinoallomurus iriomotensis]
MRVLRSYERYMARMKAQSVKARAAVRFAYRQVGKPYQWGGAGPRTYDCSGLVMAAWRKGGLRLPHRADLQHRMIRRKVGLKHLRPGDLVFFSGDHHVGIYVGRRHFLHAPHTGARVQRGTLSGWRLRVFAGAARPGAPAYQAWPHWVRALAKQHEAERHPHAAPHRRHDDAHTDVPDGPQAETPAQAQTPAQAETPATAPDGIQQEVQGPEDDQTGPYNEAGQPSTAPVTPPPASERAQEPAGPAPSTGSRLLSVPLLRMSAPRGDHHHADPAPRPAPKPGAHAGSHAGARTGTRPHRPPATVRRQNDEQRFDRDFSDGDDQRDDDAGDTGNDGIDLRSLLGNAP